MHPPFCQDKIFTKLNFTFVSKFFIIVDKATFTVLAKMYLMVNAIQRYLALVKKFPSQNMGTF